MLAIRWVVDDMALAYSQQLAILLTMLLGVSCKEQCTYYQRQKAILVALYSNEYYQWSRECIPRFVGSILAERTAAFFLNSTTTLRCEPIFYTGSLSFEVERTCGPTIWVHWTAQPREWVFLPSLPWLALAAPCLQLPHQLVAYLNQRLPIKPEEPEKPGGALGTVQYGSVRKVLYYYSIACGVARMDFTPLSALL